MKKWAEKICQKFQIFIRKKDRRIFLRQCLILEIIQPSVVSHHSLQLWTSRREWLPDHRDQSSRFQASWRNCSLCQSLPVLLSSAGCFFSSFFLSFVDAAADSGACYASCFRTRSTGLTRPFWNDDPPSFDERSRSAAQCLGRSLQDSVGCSSQSSKYWFLCSTSFKEIPHFRFVLWARSNSALTRLVSFRCWYPSRELLIGVFSQRSRSRERRQNWTVCWLVPTVQLHSFDLHPGTPALSAPSDLCN